MSKKKTRISLEEKIEKMRMKKLKNWKQDCKYKQEQEIRNEDCKCKRLKKGLETKKEKFFLKDFNNKINAFFNFWYFLNARDWR